MFSVIGVSAQEQPQEEKKIKIVHGANFTKDEANFPGASIFSKDDKQVKFEHQGADMWCDIAIFYQKENRLIALDNVRVQQGDSIQMDCGKIEYFGDIKLVKATRKVLLQSPEMKLETDTLYFDRAKQESYYNHFGKITDTSNVITSRRGRYYITPKKYQLLDSVVVNNPDYHILSERMDYYTNTENAYMYGPSTITGEDYKMYCERGFYDTKIQSGYGIKNTRIDYDNRIIQGDSVYFDKTREFASATNNIVVTDTVNDGVVRAHYAEVFKALDSVFATKKAVSISVMENDSLYMHGDTLMLTGPENKRIVRAFRNAKYFKKDISGKCDSIHYEQSTGVTQLIRNPVIWNFENQMTGDSIHLISDMKTEKLDSLKVIENAFIISLDTISKTGYNQAKGKNLFGKFEENELRIIDLEQNVEILYYSYNDDPSPRLIGIDEQICGKVSIFMENSQMVDYYTYLNPKGVTYPEGEEPENGVKLDGFIWRGDERIHTKEDIFDEDDLNLVLPVIKGLTEPIDLEATEEDRNNNQNDPVNNLPVPNSKATQPKKADPTKLKVAPNKTSLQKSPAKLEKAKTKEN